LTLYVDTSALLKRYVEEPESAFVDEVLNGEDSLVTARHTMVELRRNLPRLLSGSPLVEARKYFLDDWASFSVVELDAATCEMAATITEQTSVRTLDALHLAAARRLGSELQFLTFDRNQAAAARSVGLHVFRVS
jgi:uncharacterized protein